MAAASATPELSQLVGETGADPGRDQCALTRVLKRSDDALYAAKHDGRNRVVAAAA